DALYTPLETDWLGGATYVSIAADATNFPASIAGSLSIISALGASVEKILSGYQSLLDAELFYESQAEQAVFASHSFFHGVKDKVVEHMRTMPPSGSVAGVYSAVDRTRGVWKAPANVSVNSIIGPVVKIDSRDQEDLNVHTTGKSVNAIRAFTGKGTLVWGSRTLAGNDNEWRYVPVRRFFIMVEESTKKATEPFVFEPNDANTWVKVRSMIENFLILQWRAGALQGAKPDQAFFVNVGLGETMTELDILEGRMIVEIGMAVVRPAEFIILRFSHKMLSSNI
ncbi:MAG: phage tail sheath C-terminal domain-containing protein, partial [Bacteroidota bacterium]|nr:phage tail sheath C-terminal domain-containing protein [Bacteroidota bacterium]